VRDIATRSWVESANLEENDFPLENLPYGVFRMDHESRIGVAISDQILDLKSCAEHGLLALLPAETLQACGDATLNRLMSLGRRHWSALRQRITGLLRADTPESDRNQKLVRPHLIPMKDAEMVLPAAIGDYTDFFTSLFHATNVGRLFRPEQPVCPNYKYVPIGYHGRASSIVVSGTPVRRPCGQRKPAHVERPEFGPCQALDYELEAGFFAGPGNALGEPIPIASAESHIFGACLLNDWSARDIQFWESQPLGPFLSKSFATSISPWVVTMEALEPFRVPASKRTDGDPAPLAYLSSPKDQERGGIDLTLEVYIQSQRMRESGLQAVLVCRSNLRHMYWTVAQMFTHHASNGCNLRPGDLLGSGTVSGPTPGSLGCLLELTHGGAQPFRLPTGEERTFLKDQDEVILRGYCQRGEPGSKDYLRIGFGECRGTISPAL
jgi:fumarylacetoacetase